MRLEKLTIAASGTTSGELDLEGDVPVGIFMPAAFTGTAMTFEVSAVDGTWVTMADGAGADISKTVAADKYIPLAPADFAGAGKIRLVSGSSEAAARKLVVAVRDME